MKKITKESYNHALRIKLLYEGQNNIQSLSPTDEEIEAEYPTYYNDKFHRKTTVNDYNLCRQEGARWMREKLTGKSDEKQKANFMQIVNQTPEEEFAMYMKLPKEEIITMLLENQRLLKAFTGEPAYATEAIITSTSYDEQKGVPVDEGKTVNPEPIAEERCPFQATQRCLYACGTDTCRYHPNNI